MQKKKHKDDPSQRVLLSFLLCVCVLVTALYRSASAFRAVERPENLLQIAWEMSKSSRQSAMSKQADALLRRAGPDPTCWEGMYSYSTCCLLGEEASGFEIFAPANGNPTCWSGDYTAARCCFRAGSSYPDNILPILGEGNDAPLSRGPVRPDCPLEASPRVLFGTVGLGSNFEFMKLLRRIVYPYDIALYRVNDRGSYELADTFEPLDQRGGFQLEIHHWIVDSEDMLRSKEQSYDFYLFDHVSMSPDASDLSFW